MIPESEAGLPPLTRRLLGWEIIIVFALSLGASALFAVIQLIGSLTARKALHQQRALLVGSFAPGRPWLDLALQLADVVTSLAPVELVFYLLARDGERPSVMGLDAAHPGQDAARGTALAALIGGTGLGVYLAAFHLGVSLNVVPENLPAVWWRTPVLILDGFRNGIVEEILVIGYLLRRLEQLGWGPAKAVTVSALLRGSYHLYQGFGGFLGNAVMGVIFALFFLRYRRVGPLIFAHFLLDAVAFVGYATLGRHLSFLH